MYSILNQATVVKKAKTKGYGNQLEIRDSVIKTAQVGFGAWMPIPREDPKPPGCSPAPAFSLHHTPSFFFFFASSMASCGELGHFPQSVLQAKEPVAWWLEQSCQAHVGTETKPPTSSHEEDKGVASPIAPPGRTCILRGSQCSRCLCLKRLSEETAAL